MLLALSIKQPAHLTLAFLHISVVSSFPRCPSQVSPETVQGATTNVLVSPITNPTRLFLQLKKLNPMTSLNSNVCCAGVWNHVHMHYSMCVEARGQLWMLVFVFHFEADPLFSVMCTLLVYKLSDSLCLYLPSQLGRAGITDMQYCFIF